MGHRHRFYLGRSGVAGPTDCRDRGPRIIYGTVLGSLLGSVGLTTGGLLGYVLMLTSARRMVKRFVGPRSLNTMERVRTGRCLGDRPHPQPSLQHSGGHGLSGWARRHADRKIHRGVGRRQRTHRVGVCGDRRWLGRSADPGPWGELCAPHPAAARRAVSHAPPSIVRDVNDTRHGSPCGLAGCFRGALIARCRWASPSVQHARRPSSQEPRAGHSKPHSCCPVLPPPS
jgi:hypothetical protein